MLLFFSIGFLEVRFLDLLDMLVVGYLFYQVYRLVKGTLAFNILIGLLFVYLASLLVSSLNMNLLSTILGEFIGVGVIAVLIVFQPEIRRFLLYLGRGGQLKREHWLRGIGFRKWNSTIHQESEIKHIINAVEDLAKTKTGALIVITITSKLQSYVNTGFHMDAKVSSALLESIFFKNSPMHDGAVIISNGRIEAAGCVLPLTENQDIPSKYGLRHRAAVGLSEKCDAVGIIVSEENGEVSLAEDGNLIPAMTIADLKSHLSEMYQTAVSEEKIEENIASPEN